MGLDSCYEDSRNKGTTQFEFSMMFVMKVLNAVLLIGLVSWLQIIFAI